MPTALEKAQASRKLAEEQLRAAEADLSRAFAVRRLDRVQNSYDAVDEGASKRRRKARIERGGEAEILTRTKHLQAINLGRNLLRNFTAAKGLDWQVRTNVVGIGPRLMLTTDDDDANKAAQHYFNGVWAKDCDARDDTPFNEILACIMSGVGTDGGPVVTFDDYTPDKDGRLLYWSADQMATVKKKQWTPEKLKRAGYGGYIEDVPDKDGNQTQQAMKQDRGIVRNRRGRVVAYIVTATPGSLDVDLKDVTILPRERAKYIKRPWRLNQLIGVPEYLPMVADLEDMYEGRTSELQSWKKAAKIYAWVKSAAQEEEALANSGRGPTGTADDPTADDEATSIKENYEAIEALTGGYTDYMDDDDEVNVHDPTRPNEAVAPFFDHCLQGAGASRGLARVFATMKAETSYTAFRGEMVMSWATFAIDQKFLERRLCDWLAVKVLKWGMANGHLKTLPDGWESKISWDWPRMPVLDPTKEYPAQQQGLKAGSLNWADTLGPDWERKLRFLAKQAKIIKKLELPLSFFETVAGAVVEDANEDNSQPKEPDQ